jgi:hypothetical protein
MEKLASTTEKERATWKREFERALSIVPKVLGESAFRRRQFNKALFETWCCCFAELNDAQRKFLLKHADSLQEAYRKVLSDDNTLLSKAVGARTSDEDSVRTRFEEIRKLIRYALEKP